MPSSDNFPSISMETKDLKDLLIWWLNPVELPPQKFLNIVYKNNLINEIHNFLKQEDYLIEKTDLSDSFLFQNLLEEYNLAFSFQNHILFSELINKEEKLIEFKEFILKISSILKPSSYFILETKIESENERNFLKELFLRNFEQVFFYVPLKKYATNPFTKFDLSKTNFCWIIAITNSSGEDPAEWLGEFFE